MRRVAVGSIIHVEFTSAYVWLLIYRRRRRKRRREGGRGGHSSASRLLDSACFELAATASPSHVGYTTICPNAIGPPLLREHRAVGWMDGWTEAWMDRRWGRACECVIIR